MRPCGQVAKLLRRRHVIPSEARNVTFLALAAYNRVAGPMMFQ